MKLKQNKSHNNAVGIYWEDIRVYKDDGLYMPTHAYTEGILVSIKKRYIIIKNPETLLFSLKEVSNHPVKKAKFYCIPKSLITKTVYYDKTTL